MTAQHVRRVADLKFDKGIHRGSSPFGYRADAASARAHPRPPIPHDREFPAVVEIFQRALTGSYSCRELASWLNRSGFKTRNRKKSVPKEISGQDGKPRKFTDDRVQRMLTNPFYAGLVVRRRRSTVQFRTGQIIEVVPKPGFRWVLEAAEMAKPPGAVPDDPLLVIGDPEGIRGPS